MTKYTERLMSRTSVAAMAAFAKEPASTLPGFAERVEETPAERTGPAPIDGLTAEEQAQVDAMQGGERDAEGAAEPEGTVDTAADSADDDDDSEGDGDTPAPADGDPAPAPADGEQRRPKTISYGRHQKELAKAEKARADLQAQLDGARNETKKEREERLRLDERSKLLFEAINTKAAPAAPAAAAAPADPEPDADEDPIGHSQWKIRKLEKTISDIQGGQQRQQEATAAETEERRVYDTLVSDIQRAGATDPTMEQAFVHLRETRFQELGFIFADIDIADPEQCATLSQAEQKKLSDNIQQTFHNEQMLVARQAIAANKSPAAVIRNLARARGWAPKAPDAPAAAAAPAPAAKNGNGAAPAARAAPAATSVKDQLNAVRDNLEASRSLSDGGGAHGGEMTPERLANLSAREFEEYYETMKANGRLDSLMGRPADM